MDSFYDGLAVSDVLVLLSDNDPSGAVWTTSSDFGFAGVVAASDTRSRYQEPRTKQSRRTTSANAISDAAISESSSAAAENRFQRISKPDKRVAQATIADVQDNGRRKFALDELVAEFDWFEFGI